MQNIFTHICNAILFHLKKKSQASKRIIYGNVPMYVYLRPLGGHEEKA